jgi:putative ABC transport system permease protein
VAGVIAYTLPARSPDGALMISLADARDQFGASTAKLWALIPRPDAQLGAFRASAETASRGLAGELLTTQQLADALGRGLDRLIGLFDVLALLTVLIGGVGIVNTLAVGVTERSREIAILRSHGMTVGQVQAMVVSEATILGAVGGVTAAVAGLLVAWVTVAVGAPGDFGAGLSVPWLPMLVVVLLGIGVSAVAGIYPARRAAATPITGELRHFE